MFTGIIADIGIVAALEKGADQDLKLAIKTSFDTSEIEIGDSIACSGVCLTVVQKGEEVLCFEASAETLSCTTLGQWEIGEPVNLEQALRVGQRLDGHMVLGHVDAVTEILSVKPDDESHIVEFALPKEQKHLIAEKGSVTLNGTSLTVNAVKAESFFVNIIPHTWKVTNFHQLEVGEQVNLEYDVIARYVARMAECR
jgi:riboflavin synthase